MKKTPEDIILHLHTTNDNHMLYHSWDMVHSRCNCSFSFSAVFCPFTSLTPQKMKISKKWKKCLEIYSFYTSAPKIMIICYTVPEIWYMTDVIFFPFWAIFHPFYPLTAPKMKISQKWKEHLEISFYTSELKIMIICYTVPDILCVTDVIIFHFGLSFAILPP